MSTAAPATKVLTLCLLRDGDKVLLGMKKRGFGAGLWNGFGGKIEPGETIEQAARRELMEEAGLAVRGLSERGVLTFTFVDDPTALEVHVFSAEEFLGDPEESEEMRPQWFPIDALPFGEMWADDPHWFPLFLDGKRFQGKFLFRGEQLLSHSLAELQAA